MELQKRMEKGRTKWLCIPCFFKQLQRVILLPGRKCWLDGIGQFQTKPFMSKFDSTAFLWILSEFWEFLFPSWLFPFHASLDSFLTFPWAQKFVALDCNRFSLGVNKNIVTCSGYVYLCACMCYAYLFVCLYMCIYSCMHICMDACVVHRFT